MKSSLILKPGREKSLLRQHPWVFSGAVGKVDGDPAAGETVNIHSSKGDWLARAAYSPHSQIRARVWTFNPDQAVDTDFFQRRIRVAISNRVGLIPRSTNAYRLIHAESDGLPGLIADRYGDNLVLQCLTAGAEYWREIFVHLLISECGLNNIYERSDAEVRDLEGLPPRAGRILGDIPDNLTIKENELTFRVDIAKGHKTGFYLDQRQNRARVRELAARREVLDCFCYSGGFGINALAGGASSVVAVDASNEALSLASENVRINHLPVEQVDFINGDVFQVLRDLRDQARKFDMVILDPPKFAPTTRNTERAARGYKDINLLAMKLLRVGGFLATFSCSGGLDATLFQKIVAGAALDAGVHAQIVERLSQGPDHPVALDFPEAAYLKGLICRIQESNY